MFKKFFEPYLEADDGLSTVANGGDSPTPEDNGDDGTPDNEPANDDAGDSGEPGEPESDPEPDITQTQAFSKRLNEARAKDLQRIAELEAIAEEKQTFESQFGRLQSVLGELGYEGSAEQIADMIEAQNRQITPEQVRFERETQEKAIKEAVQNSPEFIHAQEMLKVQTQLANEAMFNSQLAKITQLNPEIKTLADLTKMPDSDVFDGLLATGKYTIDTAYKRLMEIRGTKPKSTDTKSHLQTVGGSSNGNYDEVPSDVMEQYKLFMPNATDKQIREHYRKNHGGK